MATREEHEEEVALLRGRQLALIQLLPTEIALQVLKAAPVDSEEEHAIVADLQTRQVLQHHVIAVIKNGESHG